MIKRSSIKAILLVILLSLSFQCSQETFSTDEEYDPTEVLVADIDPEVDPATINPNAPAGPGNLLAVAVSYHQVDLTWDDNSTNENGFKVYRKRGSSPWVLKATLGAGATNFSCSDMIPNRTYSFKVVAFNSYGKAASNIITAMTTDPDGMSLIPAGCFRMGDPFNELTTGETPVHKVCITSSYYMDDYEVTNAEYAACVSGGACTAPSLSESYTRASYYGNPAYDNFPVVYVNWNQAIAFCTWAGKRLPTEAEWEYAGRGGLKGKRYPWGDAITGTDANFRYSGDPYEQDTTPVGYYSPNGFGLYDMSGNVYEWVNDWFDINFYSTRPKVDTDPTGPATGDYKVRRGGNYNEDAPASAVAGRWYSSPLSSNCASGFRCALD